MGKRRMFSQSITESDAFLDMPLSSQMLYIHLGMNADDDGFVQPKKIIRMIGASIDDFNILVAKRFLLTFESGVAVIKHWHINNTIQKDRYHATTYRDESSALTVKKNKAYTESKKALRDNRGMFTKASQNGYKMDSESRLDKVSIVKTKLINTTNVVFGDKPPEKFGNGDINFLFEYWQQVIGFGISGKQQDNRRAASNLLKKNGLDTTKRLIDILGASLDDRYAPRIGDFCALQKKLPDLLAWARKRNNHNGVEVIS